MRKFNRVMFPLFSYALFSICALCHGQSPEEIKRVFRENFSKATTVTERRRLANALINNHAPKIKKSFKSFSGAGWNGALRAPGFEMMLTNCIGSNKQRHGFIFEVQAARDVSAGGFEIKSCNFEKVLNGKPVKFDIIAINPSTGGLHHFEAKDWKKNTFTPKTISKLLDQLSRQKAALPGATCTVLFNGAPNLVPPNVQREIKDLGVNLICRNKSPHRAARELTFFRTGPKEWQAAIESSAARHSRAVRASQRGKSPPKAKSPRSNSSGGRLSRAGSAMGVASAFSAAINGYGVLEGETNILDATQNIVADTALAGASYIVAEGILEQFGSGWVLTVPYRSVEFGVATFVFDGATVLYAYTKGDISEDEVLKRTSESAVTALAAGSAHYVAVLLAPTAVGGVVPLAIGIGTAICVAEAFDMYEEYKNRKYLKRGDILGKLPKSIRNRLTLFDETRRQNPFLGSPRDTLIDSEPKDSLINPRRKTLLD